jgi:tetratricopeptide (TPR) repeat protein
MMPLAAVRTKEFYSFVVAVAFCTIAGCRDPGVDKAMELCWRADEAAARKDFAVAMRYFDEALRVGPKAPLVYYDRSLAYKAMGEYDRAIADCTEAIRLRRQDCDGALFCMERAELHEKKGEYDNAIDDYTEAIRLGPEYITDLAKCYRGRGRLYKKKGEMRKAEADFSEAERVFSN